MSEPQGRLEPFFLEGTRGRRFCLLHHPAPSAPMRGALLHLHPFAEEMNKCRRMVALGAAALSGAGWAVLQIDLGGCGDSEGEFADATWGGWVDDALDGAAWLGERSGLPVGLWGVRAGALLVPPVAQRIQAGGPILLWQPVLSGKQHLQQFMRMKQVAGWSRGERPGSAAVAREPPSAGAAQEVAGYVISPVLADGLGRAEWHWPGCGSVLWCEVVGAGACELSGGGRKAVDQMRARGAEVACAAVAGPQFWQTVETEICPELVDVTLRLAGSVRQ